MNKKSLTNKPLASAQDLHCFLSSLPKQTMLDSFQQKALEGDLRAIENLIALLKEANSVETWGVVWRMVQEQSRSLGGYVGDKLGQDLNQLFEILWRDVLDAYSEIKE